MDTAVVRFKAQHAAAFGKCLTHYRGLSDEALTDRFAEQWKRRGDLEGLLNPCPLGRCVRFITCSRISAKKRQQATQMLNATIVRGLVAGELLEERGWRIFFIEHMGISTPRLMRPKQAEAAPPP